ncbi:MAG TPA: hypothetical protein PK402_11505, partial [Tepidisphaeraceae bacterium]|nr:hypothetical protein [Tepidisphaeraceae bacterium]
GGLADYTGSLVGEMPLACAAAVGLQPRADRSVQIVSFNLLDDHRPFTLVVDLDSLDQSNETLQKAFGESGRKWAGYIAGCLTMLHRDGLIDLHEPSMRGLNLALLSTVPLGAGVSSSAAIEVATMMNLVEHFSLRDRLDAMKIGAMCQRVENEIVGAPCGIMDQVTSAAGRAGSLLRLVCQPHELKEPLTLPDSIRVVGINSNVKHSVGGGEYGKTRCAAFMGHKMILEQMRKFGAEAGRELIADPMRGYLANLDPDDYKRFFRVVLPETILGKSFIEQFESTIDKATRVNPDVTYSVQAATDHHVLEARRVREFVRHLEEAKLACDPKARKLSLDKSGHLMYASHKSYGDNAHLGAVECDCIVDLVRANESGGLCGAKITGGGSGGTVAVLCDESTLADETLDRVMLEYAKRTDKSASLIAGTSDGGWWAGTELA